MRLNYAFLSDSVEIIDNGAKIRVENPTPAVLTEKMPFEFGPFSVTVNFKPEDTNPHDFSLRIKNPDGDVIKKFDIHLESLVTPEKQNRGHIVNFKKKIEMTKAGTYSIDVLIDNAKLTSIPFDCVLVKK